MKILDPNEESDAAPLTPRCDPLDVIVEALKRGVEEPSLCQPEIRISLCTGDQGVPLRVRARRGSSHWSELAGISNSG